MYYTECPYCGSNLDPGEKCDCEQAQAKRIKYEPKTDTKKVPAV